MHEFRTWRKIEFVDTDMGGIVHFSRFLIFMETAEHEFLEAIGTRVDLELDGCKIGWPRVAVACRYKSPARFGETLDIHLRVIRKGTNSVYHDASHWASIAPAIWSFMLALRSRGLGSAWTTIHLRREREMAELLGIPYETHVQAGLFPIAYTIGTEVRRASRQPVGEVLVYNRW